MGRETWIGHKIWVYWGLDGFGTTPVQPMCFATSVRWMQDYIGTPQFNSALLMIIELSGIIFAH